MAHNAHASPASRRQFLRGVLLPVLAAAGGATSPTIAMALPAEASRIEGFRMGRRVGLQNGRDDGWRGAHLASYRETPPNSQTEAYRDAYQKGYAQGYELGYPIGRRGANEHRQKLMKIHQRMNKQVYRIMGPPTFTSSPNFRAYRAGLRSGLHNGRGDGLRRAYLTSYRSTPRPSAEATEERRNSYQRGYERGYKRGYAIGRFGYRDQVHARTQIHNRMNRQILRCMRIPHSC